MHKLIVKSQKQVAELWKDHTLLKTYCVSTAANGLGNTENSYCTPIGKLRIAEKIGDGEPVGMIFRARKPTGDIWSSTPDNPFCHSQEDLVTTRILWLEGAEEANKNTLQRYIYLHGTNHENTLGTPNSHGCIRLSNKDILELFALLPVGTDIVVE